MNSAKNFKLKNLIIKLNVDELCEILEKNDVGDCCDVIRTKQIDGRNFLDLTEVQVSSWIHKLKRQQINRLSRVIQLAHTNPEQFLEGNETEQKNLKTKIQYDDDEQIYSNRDMIKNLNDEQENIYGNKKTIKIDSPETSEQLEENEYGNKEIVRKVLKNESSPKPYKSPVKPKPIKSNFPTKPPTRDESKFNKSPNFPKKLNVNKDELSNIISKMNQNISKLEPKSSVEPKTQSKESSNCNETKKLFQKPTTNTKSTETVQKPRSNRFNNTKPKNNESMYKKPLPDEPAESNYLIMMGNLKKTTQLTQIDSSDDDSDDLEDPLAGCILPQPPKIKSYHKHYDDMKEVPRNDQIKNQITKLSNYMKDQTDSKIKPNFSSYKAMNNEIIRRVLPPIHGDNQFNITSREEDLSENHYDAVIYKVDDYKRSPWYYEKSREEANAILKNKPNGSFIVRSSTKKEYICTLMILYCNKIYNLGINKDEHGLLTIGSGGIKKTFLNVNEIIDYYSQNEFSLIYNGVDVYIKLNNFHS